MTERRKAKTVKIGALKIGGSNPVSIQSMAKTDTQDVSATVRQIKALERAGCEIIRVAVRNAQSIPALVKIKAKIKSPLVADIHFNYRLALEAIASGVDGLRLNPGNIYRREEVGAIAKAAKKKKIPIRVGVNSGSLRNLNTVIASPKGAKQSQGRDCFVGKNRKQKPPRNDECSLSINRPKTEELAYLMVTSALDYIELLEGFDFYDIIVSLKASDVPATVQAYRSLARRCRYPFHLGITATGLPQDGAIKSAIGIGALLLEGIGDTIRVSLSGSPQEEVRVAQQILQALGLRYFGPEIISCPTCGRTQVDVVKIAKQVKSRLQALGPRLQAKCPFTIAIMGCEVNGPGEAREADIGIAGGKGCAVLFKRGKVVKRVKESRIVDVLVKELVYS